MIPRQIEKIILGQPTSDGAGVKLTRALNHTLQRRLDPFLMLDHFHSDRPDDYLAGFPDHPHRGFETVTYMLEGKMRHRDSAGHEGLLESGGVQWMTTGRGLIHSELPEQENGLMSGFQLWINLPASEKMSQPRYRDFKASEIPQVKLSSGGTVKVIAGQFDGVAGAVQQPFTEPLYLDVQLNAGESADFSIPAEHHAFLFVHEGEVADEAKSVTRNHLAVLSNTAEAEGIRLHSEKGARFILVAGKPLNEPIVQYGPFVMNTEAQIRQTLADYQSGVFEKSTSEAINLGQ
jgi:redox-sensitive bicupin YhaK (pirin superfamily)